MARRRGGIDFEILNAHEISEFFVELQRVPQKSVTKAARAGAMIIKRKVKASSQIPVKYGFLQRSIKEFQEKKQKGKRNNSGKAAFDVGFDHRYNNIFQKHTKAGGKGTRGSKNPKDMYYYPASMEYGFATSNGGVGGHYFLKSSAVAESANVQDKMLEVLSDDIDKIKSGR